MWLVLLLRYKKHTIGPIGHPINPLKKTYPNPKENRRNKEEKKKGKNMKDLQNQNLQKLTHYPEQL